MFSLDSRFRGNDEERKEHHRPPFPRTRETIQEVPSRNPGWSSTLDCFRGAPVCGVTGALLPFQAARHRDTDAARPHRHLLCADVRRTGRALRHRARTAPRSHGEPRAQVRPRSAASRSDLALPGVNRHALRLRPLVPLHGSERQRHHPAGLSGDPDLRGLVLPGRGSGGRFTWHCGGRLPQHRSRLSGGGRFHRRPGASELRDGADSHPRLHAVARLAAGWRLAGGAVALPRHAGHRVVDVVHGLYCAHHAILDAGSAERGLHPHRPRQGSVRAAHRVRPCPQADDACRCFPISVPLSSG